MLAVGLGWRGAYAGLALMAAAMALALVRGPYEHARRGRPHASIGQLLRELPGLLRTSGVVRWLALGHLADLLLDVLMTFCALYFVDVVGVDPAAAGLAVAVLMLGGLAGDVLLIPLLERLDGVRLLRRTALAALVLYVAFLLVPGYWPKLALLALIGPLRSGWWQVLEARVYASVPEHSGSVVALGALTGLLPASYPLILGAIAAQFGLAWTMAVLALGPISLIVGLPHEREPRAGDREP
jgi:FSR family fosmidomycin resistance protein-like MFS transporter